MSHRGVNVILLGMALAAVPAAAAEGDAEYREHVMEAIGGHMQAAADIAQQKVAHQSHLLLHVSAIAELSTIVNTLFPEGSEGGDALPGIWENPEDFAGKITTLEEAAGGLKAALEGGGNVGQAFQQLGQACKSCHDDYRDD